MKEKWRKLMMLGDMMWLSNCYHMLFLLDKVTRPNIANDKEEYTQMLALNSFQGTDTV